MDIESHADVLPPLYARWASEFLSGAIPAEIAATCSDCAMLPGERESAPTCRCCPTSSSGACWPMSAPSSRVDARASRRGCPRVSRCPEGSLDVLDLAAHHPLGRAGRHVEILGRALLLAAGLRFLRHGCHPPCGPRVTEGALRERKRNQRLAGVPLLELCEFDGAQELCARRIECRIREGGRSLSR